MTEELKTGASRDYYNVSQSDIRGLVRGQLNILKGTLATAKSGAVNAETKFHYLDCIKRIETILDPK